MFEESLTGPVTAADRRADEQFRIRLDALKRGQILT